MPVHIALLRAVNLGPHNKVPMADLRELVSELGYKHPKTLLQSGNVVFEGGRTSTQELERLLEAAAKKRLNLNTEFFVRTARELQTVIKDNPFAKEAKADPSHLVVMFLKDAPDRAQLTALEEAIVGREVVRSKGRHAYIVYPDGIGRSRLTNALLEKKLGTRGTGRNWNTLLKLAALSEAE